MPENWRSYPIRDIAANVPQSFTDGDWIEAPHIRETGIRLIQTGNIGIGSFIDRSRKYISQVSFDTLHCKEVRPGDLLICRLAEPIGRACFAPDLGERMITSVDVTILRVDAESFDSRFVSFCINTPECLRQCETVSGGTTRQRISRTNLGKVEIKAPSVGEQRRIAEILSTLDEAIEQTEALIAKHSQIKAGLMHDLFTRGVTKGGHLRATREQAPELYKESPLGWIPKEWDTATTGDLCTSIVPGRNKPSLDSGVFPWITITDLSETRITESRAGLSVSATALRSAVGRTVPAGSVIMSCVGEFGIAAIVGCELVINQQLHGFVASERIYPEWLMHSLRLQGPVMERIATQTTIKYINKAGCESIPVAIPTIEEQQLIVGRIEGIESIENSESQLAMKLRSKKHGLMHDLLTGHVRVPVNEAEANRESA